MNASMEQPKLTEDNIIETLGLEPLTVEGGMYRACYQSQERLGEGPAATAIYYLLTAQAFSHLHRLTADEVYHHYLGDPVELFTIDEQGNTKRILLGKDLLAGQVPQAVVPKGCWQGSHLAGGGEYALMGTTMSPGFTPSCYEHADPEALLMQYPAAEAVIRRLTGPVRYR